ncbi:CCA tRNA nucleotidyltransferase [Thermodesulfobacteriota bacterium]
MSKQNIDQTYHMMSMDMPGFVKTVISRLYNYGFKAYVVGGAIRDVCLKRPVMDWDVATSASPEEIRSIFHDIRNFSLKHETVTLVDAGHLYEITSFRGAGDSGHNIKEDLGHRDFTINAMAYDIDKKVVLDPYGGRDDISGRLVRAVENPRKRFSEDPLRLLRAIRIATELEFRIEHGTMNAICSMSGQLANVAKERVRDEFMKILLSQRPSKGFNLLRGSGLLKHFLPELLEGFLKRQNAYHRYTIYRHIMETIDGVQPYPVLRLAALLHDIAKPRVRQKVNNEFRFFRHAETSALLAEEIMQRLRFSKEMINEVVNLVALHMIEYDSGWGQGAIRRLMRRAGPENMNHLLSFRRADLIAHGLIDRKLELLSELEKRVGELKKEPIAMDAGDLAVNGEQVMDILGLSPGPAVGKVLEMLTEKVTDQPDLNTEVDLTALLKEMREKSTAAFS